MSVGLVVVARKAVVARKDVAERRHYCPLVQNMQKKVQLVEHLLM